MIAVYRDPATNEKLYVAYGVEGDYLGEFTNQEEAKALIKKNREDWSETIGFNPEDYE